MPTLDRAKAGIIFDASLLLEWTACPEPAAARGMRRVWDLPFDRREVVLDEGRRVWDRSDQRFRVWVQWPFEQLMSVGHLHQSAQVHHGHVVGEETNDREIVRDHEDREMLVAQVEQEVHDLCADGDVEGAYRFIADQQARTD